MRALSTALNRLCKWRSVLAGWQVGTKSMHGDPNLSQGLRAIRDAADARLVQRAELTALMDLLISKGVITRPELSGAIAAEADQLATDMEEVFPGFKATDSGITIEPGVAAETMRKLGFPD